MPNSFRYNLNDLRSLVFATLKELGHSYDVKFEIHKAMIKHSREYRVEVRLTHFSKTAESSKILDTLYDKVFPWFTYNRGEIGFIGSGWDPYSRCKRPERFAYTKLSILSTDWDDA